jgi:hypothetical protein
LPVLQAQVQAPRQQAQVQELVLRLAQPQQALAQPQQAQP